jgi:hypothetical protein
MQILFCFSPLNVRYGSCCCTSHDAKLLLEKVGIKSPGSVMQMGSACFSMKLAIMISVFFYEKVFFFFFPQKNWEISGIFLLLQILPNLLIIGIFFSNFSISQNRIKRKEKKRKSLLVIPCRWN